MGILSQTFGDKLNNFQTASSSSSPIQVTTTSGKQYSLDGNQVNWIKSRYKQDGADTYGWDDADQYAKQTGQLSAKMRSTYKNSNVDRQLAEMGLPSEKNLEKYIADYQNWHTGTVDKVYKDVPKEQWSKISEFYKQDWVYESTAEDQARKKKGLMPTSLLSKYGDNELDESLMMRNLPSVSEMQKYAERYQNFTGIDTFYSNVAAKWTDMRLFSTDDEGNHIKNDDTVYTVDGEKVVGSDLYAAAFYDELLKKNENGERVYASITDLFQNNHVYEKGSSSNENYNIMRGKEVVSIGKAEALADDFLRYEAFSYDDFESKYGDYFSKLFADKQLMDGDGNPATYKDGRPVTAASQLAQIDEWEKLKEEADFYNIDHDASESFSDNTSVESFLDRWNLNNPTSSALDMFTSMREHGVDDKYIKQAYVQLRDSTKFGSEERKAVKQAWNDYKATIPKEERGGLLGKIAQANRDAIADSLASPDTLLPNMQEYISGMDGGLTATNIKSAVDYYAKVGVEPGIVNETTKMMRDAYIANTDEVDPEVLKGFDYALSEDVKMTQRQLDESFDAFMKDSIVASSDASVVNNSWSRIEDAVGKIIGDSADASIDPDTLFAIIKATADLPWSNEIAVREALADHGFTAEGDFNDPLFANEWTKNWDGLDRSRFRSMMSDAGFRLVGDIDRTVPESFKKDPSERLTELISSGASKDEWNSFLFGGWNWDSEKTFSENIKNNLAPSRETESLMIYGGKDISAKEYELALDWMDEMVSNGRLTKFEAYNYLCSRGLQDAIEKYDKADWYESIFKEKIVPEMWENSAKTDQLFWDSCTDDDRKSIADSMWADIPDEEKAKAIEDYDWRFDSNIHRTAAQTWTEQLAATIPSAVLTVAGGAVAAADWAATLVSGKDELWETTKELNSAAGYVSSYGNVEDNVNGALASRITTDAVSEMLKMYSLGAVGGKVAGALGSSTSKMSGFILDFVKASPFSTIAIGNSFAEAKSEGASNAEALPYAFVLGTLEGVIESLNVDKIWGKVLGQGRFGKMLVEGGQAFTKQSVLTKAWLASLPVAALGEATEEGLGYCAEALWKTVASWGGSEWASNFEWSTSDMVEQALMGGLTGMLGAGLAKGSITTDSIMVDYYKNNGQLSADIVDVELASKYWDSFTDAQRSLYRNGGANVKSIDDFSNLMVQLDNCFRGLTSAQDTYSKLVANEDAKYEAVQRDVKKAEAKLASFNPLDPEQAKDFAKAYSELVKLKGDPNDANSTSALRDAKTKHDAALEAGAYNRDTTLANINAQIAMIQGQFAEHYAGLYLKNEGAIKAKDYNAIEKNMANAKKNGDRVTSETIEQPKNSAVDNTANPWWSKQKAAETMPARQFTTDDENQVLDAAKNMKYKGNISFVDMPNENWEGRINGNGDIEINRSKLTSREAQRISENPAMWVMEHELYHFIQSNGGDLASELRTTVRKMYEQDPRLARGNVSANWTKLLDSIIAQRNAQGLEISTRAQAEEEVLADFFRNYAFRSEDAIKSLCQTNGNLGERILSWLRYKINDLKLRRSKDSWAREILNVERQYALALREAGHKLNKAKAGDINTKYSSEKSSSAGNMTDDILNGYDDNNNIIPLSQRGDFTRNELRYSGGLDIDQLLNDMANQGEQNSAYDNLVNQQGAKPQGKEPRARDIKVPERVSEQRRESDFVRSLLESDKVTDAQVEDIKRKIVEEDWGSYIPTTDQERMDEARDYISRRQPLQAQQEFHDMVMQGKLGVKTNALGIQLMADASARGDIASVLDIASDLQVAATEAGQSAQIFSVLKELKGVGSAWYMQKVVDRLNSKYADEISKGKMQSITVSPVLMEQLAQATTVDQIANAEEAVAKEIARQVPLTWTDRLSNWRYFSMLANPTTHVRNVTGNVLMAGLNQAKDAVATGIESAFVKDEGQRAHAILTAADKNAWGDFAQKSYEENARNLSGGGKLGFETFVKQNMRSFDTKWLNALAQFNFNALEGEDVLFIRPAYKNALMQYMKAQGFTMNENGDVGKVDAKGNFVEMTNAQRTAAEDWASQQAWKATFRDASSLATMLNKISKEGKLAQLIVEGVMPFKKTPINIARRGLEYSPAGIVMGTTQLLTKVKQGKMTAAQAIDNLASGITGSALMALGVFLAKAGLIRAGGEDEKKYETYLEDTGDQTYSMKFGDASINMSAIAPATIPLFMGVALNEMIENNGETIDLSTITDTIAGTLNPFMEMSFMSSLNSALKNYNSNGIGGALGSTIMTAGQNYFSQYLPTLGGKVAQFVDPTVRTTKSDATSPVGGNMDYYVRSLMKKVPGVEATLQPDVNVWGQTTTKDSFGEYLLDFANKFVLPTNVKITNRDAVDNELIRVVESTGVTDFLPSDGNKYFTVKGQKYTMNARQYTQYSRERGQAAYAAIKEVMASPAYITASDETKADMLNKAKEAAYKAVNNIWKDKLGAFNN